MEQGIRINAKALLPFYERKASSMKLDNKYNVIV